MAEALARAFHSKGVATAEQMCCTDPVAARRDLFDSLGFRAYETAQEVGMWGRRPRLTAHHQSFYVFLQVAQNADVLFMSVKPQYVAPILQDIKSTLSHNHVIVSIAAGVTIHTLKVCGVSVKYVVCLRYGPRMFTCVTSNIIIINNVM